MTPNTLPHRLRTYLGGELGNEAADEIERLQEDCQRWEMAARIARDGFDITTIARTLAERGMTIVSAADAEKVRSRDCDDLRKDADRYRWLRDNWTRLTGSANGNQMSLEIAGVKWAHFGPDVVDAAVDKVMGVCDGR